MVYLVTGANGFLGRGIVKELLDKGNNVIATDFSTQLVDSRAERVDCNLFSLENPYQYFRQPDMLIHLAWRNGFVHNDNSHMEDLPQHCTFIEKMLVGGLRKLAVMGSMHEIGFYEGSIDENTKCEPQTLYGISKNALRMTCEYFAGKYQAKLLWLRAFYIVSNDPYGSSIFSKITKAELDKQESFPFTMGQNQYDFINYEDFCRQIAAVVQQDAHYGIINICSGRPQTLAQRVETFIKENNFSIKLRYGAFPDRPYDSKAVWGNDRIISEVMQNYDR